MCCLSGLCRLERGAFVGFGNTAEAAHDVVLGRRQRGSPADGRFNRGSGQAAGHESRGAEGGRRVTTMTARRRAA